MRPPRSLTFFDRTTSFLMWLIDALPVPRTAPAPGRDDRTPNTRRGSRPVSSCNATSICTPEGRKPSCRNTGSRTALAVGCHDRIDVEKHAPSRWSRIRGRSHGVPHRWRSGPRPGCGPRPRPLGSWPVTALSGVSEPVSQAVTLPGDRAGLPGHRHAGLLHQGLLLLGDSTPTSCSGGPVHMRPAPRDHTIGTPVRRASLKIGKTTASYPANRQVCVVDGLDEEFSVPLAGAADRCCWNVTTSAGPAPAPVPRPDYPRRRPPGAVPRTAAVS